MEEKEMKVTGYKKDDGRVLVNAKSIADIIEPKNDKEKNNNKIIKFNKDEVNLIDYQHLLTENIEEEEYESRLESIISSLSKCIKDGTEIIGKRLRRGIKK